MPGSCQDRTAGVQRTNSCPTVHPHSGFGQEHNNTVAFAAAGPWLSGKHSTTFYSNEFILIMD